MKKLIFLFLIASLNINCYSQELWAPVGSTWHYDFYGQFATGYVKVESIKDTVVEAKLCKYLYITKTVFEYPNVTRTYNIDSVITYQNGYKIYQYAQSKFVMLYDFNPTVGDVWDVDSVYNVFNDLNSSPINTVTCPPGKVKVDSVKTVLVHNKSLKAIYTSPFELSEKYFEGVILEGVGCLGYMFPTNFCNQIIDTSFPGALRCYSSVDFSNSWSEKPCDYITGLKQLNFETSPPIVFDTRNRCIRIKDNSNLTYPVKIELYALSGMQLSNSWLENSYSALQINSIKSGLYIVSLKDSKSKLYHSKITIP